MRRVLMYAIPIVMAAGLLAAVANSPEDEGQDVASGGDNPSLEQGGKVTGTTLPAVIETPDTTAPTTAPPAPETTTTTAAPPPPPTTVTTAARPRPASSPPRRTTPPTTAAPVQPVVQQPEPVDCGTGSASARTRLVNDGSGYKLVATVINESTKAIQLDSLAVRATYADGSRDYNVNVGGRVVEPRPGQAEMDFEIPESAGAGAPTDFHIAEFKFHTAGLPQCASS